MSWRTLGETPPARLGEARLEIHHAAQLVAAVGLTLLPPRPDDSRPNFGWDDAHGALRSHPVGGPRPVQAALRLADRTLLLLDTAGGVLSSCRLAGRTQTEARRWLEGALAARRGRPLPDGLTAAAWDLPPHPVAEGRPFAAPGPADMELARWFANADLLLRARVAAEPGASPVRIWPHHFDQATLLPGRPGGDLAASRIGVGLSPGDAFHAEPYWYVTPDPHPDDPALPALPEGAIWQTEGFLGAVLTGTRALAGAPADQERHARDFLTAAVATCRALVAAA